MANVGTAVVKVVPSMEGFSSKLTSGLSSAFSSSSSIGSNAGNTLGTSFNSGVAAKMGAISGIVSSVTSKAMSVVSNSIGSAVSRVDTLNNFPKVMAQMGFSAESAQASIDKLSAGIQGLPTNLDEIASSAQSIALLTGDLDGATETALALNNAFLASGSSTADASRGLLQYTQMLSKGSVDLQSWRTLQETMGYALRETANAMGFVGDSAVNDLYSALQSGEVTFDDFNAKLVELNQAEGGLADTAQTASSGIATSMSIMQSAVTRNLASVIDAFADTGIISEFAQSVKTALDNVGANAGPIAQDIAEKIRAVVDAFGGMDSVIAGLGSFVGVAATVTAGLKGFEVISSVKTKFTELSTGIQSVVDKFAPLISNFTASIQFSNTLVGPIETLKNGFSILGSNIAGLMTPFTALIAIGAAVAAGFVYMYSTSEEFRTAVAGIVEQMGTALAPILTTLQEFMASFTPTLQMLGEVLTTTILPVLGNIALIVMQFVADLLPTIAPVLETITTTVSAALAVVQTVVQTALTVVQDIINVVTAAISGDWEAVWTGIGTLLSDVWEGICNIVTTVTDSIASVITSTLETIQTVWESAWSAVGNLVSNAWDLVTQTVSGGAEDVLDVVGGIPDGIAGFFSNAGTLLLDAGKSIINGLKEGIESAISGVYNFVSGIAGKIASLKGPLSYDKVLLTPAGKAIVQGLYDGLADNIGTVYSLVGGIADNISDEINGDISTSINATAGYSASGIAGADARGTTNVYIDGSLLNVDSRIINAVDTIVSTVKQQQLAGMRA